MAVKDKLLDLIFPRRCVVCDELTDRQGEALCSRCQGRILYIKEPCCMKCGKQLKSSGQEYCGDCQNKKHYYM
ncbi:MAG: double zinc ribbon domain-containing protein, partial [Lachnospiraceae bacterium]|nr:double zinc ribbon domain-containing protein [Lachnospiraceae bacterium]